MKISKKLLFGLASVVLGLNAVNLTLVNEVQASNYFTNAAGEPAMNINDFVNETRPWASEPITTKKVTFHWYKKARVKPCYNNTDFAPNRSVTMTEDVIDEKGIGFISGYVKVGNAKYYIESLPLGNSYESINDWTCDAQLIPSTFLAKPKLGYVTHHISTYYLSSSTLVTGKTIGVIDDSEIFDNLYIPKNKTIMIPTHHQAISLCGNKYVPVILNRDDTVTNFVTESDFNKYIANGDGHKMKYNGSTISQQNGEVTCHIAPKIYSKMKKVVNRAQKSAVYRHNSERDIRTNLKFMMESIHKYGTSIQ